MPSYRTRSQAVLQLAKDTPLYATVEDTRVKSFTRSSGCLFPRTKSLLQVKIVATGNREVVDSDGMVSLDINFWSLESQYLSESPDFSVPVNIPSNWTSQMYLDALSYMVKHDGIVSVNTAKAVIGRYCRYNNPPRIPSHFR
jgi:hypothetical protein